MKIKVIASLAILQIALLSCKKETTSADSASFYYQVQTTNRSTAVNKVAGPARTETTSIQWTSGTASASQIKFEAKANNSEVEFKQNTQQQIDLFATATTLGNITLPPGTYNEIEFKAALSPVGNTPALQLNGTFTSGTTITPISFIVNSSVEIKAEKNSVTIGTGTAFNAINTIDLSQLLTGITAASLQNATITNGTIIISANSNSTLYTTILNNLASHHGEAEIGHH